MVLILIRVSEKRWHVRDDHGVIQFEQLGLDLRLSFNTSRPAAAIFPLFHARTRAFSSTTGPRDVFTTMQRLHQRKSPVIEQVARLREQWNVQ